MFIVERRTKEPVLKVFTAVCNLILYLQCENPCQYHKNDNNLSMLKRHFSKNRNDRLQ